MAINATAAYTTTGLQAPLDTIGPENVGVTLQNPTGGGQSGFDYQVQAQIVPGGEWYDFSRFVDQVDGTVRNAAGAISRSASSFGRFPCEVYQTRMIVFRIPAGATIRFEAGSAI